MTDHPDPTRVAADVDVLAADLLVGGKARESLDLLRDHEWLTLITTDEILTETTAVIATLADDSLATDWERRARADFVLVEPTANGHPALVAAASGNAATVLTFDERLQSPKAGASIRSRVATSVKSPKAFVSLVDPDTLASTLADSEK